MLFQAHYSQNQYPPQIFRFTAFPPSRYSARMTTPRLCLPNGLKPFMSARRGTVAESQLLADRDTLGEIFAGLDRLEALMDQTPVFTAAAQRGYFTPDEDDRVRQGLLAYRNYRLAAYEVILRYRDFAQLADESLRLRGFLAAFAAALVLYAKSLKLIQVVEHRPLLRAKINEPDAKFDLEAGFFDDVLVGYSSLSNYRQLARTDHYWRGARRSEMFRRLDADGDWGGLIEIIRHRRRIVRQRLFDVLRRRLWRDWRAFWQTALRPARRTRYSLQALLGGSFAGVQLVANPDHALTPTVLAALRPQLQPGDVLLCRAEGKLTTALLPGFWSHAAIYLGARDELAALGVCEQPHAAKHWDELPAHSGPLGCVIEGIAPRVRLASLESSLNADHVVVLRPTVAREELAAALGEAFGHLGKPYDFEFDFNVTSRVVCTELVYRCYHHRGAIHFPLVKRLGRYTLSGDDIAHLTLDELAKADGLDHAPLRPVALILKRRDGQAHAVPPQRVVSLLRRIRNGWRPARKAPVSSVAAPPA